MADNQEIYADTSRYHYLLEDLELDQSKERMIPGMLKDIEFIESEGDRYHITNPTDIINLENVAFQYYGEAKYWWIIAIANNILDPFDSDDAGLTLRIPAFDRARAELDKRLQS